MQHMQASSALLPLLRSPFQGELLASLFLNPDREFTATELAERFGVSQSTASREADRFVAAGYITERRSGNLRLLRANPNSVVARPLTDLLAVTYGPIPVLTELLTGVGAVEAAFIFGSWAARYRGQAGPVPNDVDVLVVGDADPDRLYDVEVAAGRRLGREVNIRRIAAGAWAATSDDPFVLSVRSQPLVALDIGSR